MQSIRRTAQALRFHEPKVDCISKGRTRTPYEFDFKVGIASTLKSNLIVGAWAM